VVATSQPLAAEAGLEILRKGGNAIDAAVATAAVLSVVEPMMVGPAGDLFAIVYLARENKLYVLNSSGSAPTGLTPARLTSLGYALDPADFGPGSGMPQGGILPVTVPGTVWGWDALLTRFGTRTFKETLQSAVDHAEHGFPVSERIAWDWELPKALPPTPSDPRGCCTQLDPVSVETWYVNGKPPVPGQVFRNPGLARTFRVLQKRGRAGFYEGEVARAIVARSTELGGTMTLADLASFRGEWVEPARSTFKGYDIYTLPPPAQTWAAGEMLNILEACVPRWAPGQSLASLGPADPRYWHFMVEAKKLAYADLIAHNADPNFAQVPLARLLSTGHAASLCGKVDPAHASATSAAEAPEGHGDTIVLTTADRHGNMVAMVNSLFDAFGSGVTVPGWGFALHNRGSLFTLRPGSPNLLAPGKRPFNTLSAGFVMRDNRPVMTVTQQKMRA
jgi:gamma-glutamyltranspeptidase/glutathione hydrolase